MRPADDQGTPHKKVRLACRRCRAKRIKCDGGIPACSHCAKAAVACVDVDGRNNDRSIPRDYATRCHARIQWLEQQIKALDPDFDLSQGPQLAPSSSDAASDSSHPREPQPISTRKRPYAAVQASNSNEVSAPTPAAEARSVAVDLGMLSLHSDSRQKHYLGSSSGLFFTNLIGAQANALASPVSTLAGPYQSNRKSSHPPVDAYHLLHRTLSAELPSPEEATTLLDAYNALRLCVESGLENTRNVDANGWPDDMPSFSYNGRYDRVGDKDATPISIFTAALHVFMVFSLAATMLTRNKNFDFSPTRFYKAAASAAPECLSSISLSALQSVLLFNLQGMMTPTNLNIWTLVHVAMSHCVDLGLHREPKDVSDMSPIALTMRRFVFYTVYNLDRSIATIQGRPLGIRDETFDLRMPDLANVPKEPVSLANGLSGLCPRLPDDMTSSIYRFKLDRHISEIKMLFYHLPTNGRVFHWPADNSAEQTRIKVSLDGWLAEIKQLWSDSDMDQQDADELGRSRLKRLKLEVLYHGAVTLLYQPSQAFPSPTQLALLQCYRSSSERIHIYNHLNNEEILYYNWRNIHGIFSSGATIIYCLWASPDIQLVVPFAEALRDLRVCSNLLSIGGQWWPSVRGGRENFDRIVDLTIKQLSRLRASNPSEAPRSRYRGRDSGNGLPIDPDLGNGAEWVPNDVLATVTADSRGESVNDLAAPNAFPYDARFPDEAGTTPVDSVMETFFADFLHGDWGWDPFSSCLDTSIL
ncbi:transcription factor domain-containing protein [Aspergillus undulatus]|uniref:transcription factor domain-containing protein n=1 Tax=Aspergillus undulatus TaxID=1810928 RepID=UPI003CCD6004